MPMEVSSETITSAMSNAFRAMLYSRSADATLNIETHYFHTVIEAASCEYDLDLGRDVWLNRQRWSRLIREYVPRAAWERFQGQAVEILAGEARDGATANFFFRDPDRYEKKHRWGGCLMGATLIGWPRPTLTFFSRTSYIGYMGLLDAGIAHVMVRNICEHFDDLSVADIGFRWYLTSAQLHHFKSIPHIYTQPDLYERLRRNVSMVPEQRFALMSDAEKHIAKWQYKIEESFKEHGPDMLDHEKYGPYRRIKRRWMEHEGLKGTPPPSCPISTLTFEKAE